MKAAATYVMESADGSLLKIGKSIDPIRRIGQLRSGSPLPLHFVDLLGPTEAWVHARLGDARSHGEWFVKHLVEERIREWSLSHYWTPCSGTVADTENVCGGSPGDDGVYLAYYAPGGMPVTTWLCALCDRRNIAVWTPERDLVIGAVAVSGLLQVRSAAGVFFWQADKACREMGVA